MFLTLRNARQPWKNQSATHQLLNTEMNTPYGEGEELGQSISNDDAALIAERATADVYTPNNISPGSKHPPIQPG